MKKPRSRYSVTPAKIIRWLAEGRGKGEGKDYKPWLTVHDVPSRGLRLRVWSSKTGRIHHLLSQLEYYYFLLLEADPDVLDIREQYPLDLKLTKAKAKELQHYEPFDRATDCPVVMTTDFLYIKLVDGKPARFARNLKHRKDLNSERTAQKIAIEDESWKSMGGVDFGIVTEKEIPRDKVRNIRWIRGALRPDYLDGIKPMVPMVEAFLRPLMEAESAPLADLTDQSDAKFSLERGSSLAIVKWLLAHRLWVTDLDRRISTIKPLRLDGSIYSTAAA